MRGFHPHGHVWSFLIGGSTIGLFFVRHGWALLLVGFLFGLLVAWAFRTGGRLASRLNRALPDSNRSQRTPLSEDPDYLAGVEQGSRAKRRQLGYADGKLTESLIEDEWRPLP